METNTKVPIEFPKRLYTVDEVAEIMNCSADIIREECRNGRFKGAFRRKPIGSSPWLIPGADAQKWLDSMRGITREEL